MAVFGPIRSERKLRRFGVLDLEWVPGEALPELVNTEVSIAGITNTLRIPLPVSKRMTEALRLRLAGYYDQVPCGSDGDDDLEMEERYDALKSIRQLVDRILVRENRGSWFFAHAGGLADMQFVLDELLGEIKAQIKQAGGGGVRSSTSYAPDGQKTRESASGVTASGREWKIKASFSGSSAIIVHVIQGKNAWHFCDSYWLLRDKLANIGKAIGVKKGDDPRALAWMSERFGRPIKDFEELSREEKRIFYAEVPDDILTIYNKLDCAILWKAVAQFEDEIVSLGGQLQQTIASTAMTLFRRAFLKRDIFTSEALNGISQDAYFASRVEVFNRSAEDFLIYDINSSFPFAMTFPLPGNLIEYRMDLPDDDTDECIYLADATVEVPEMYLPPLPYRKDNRVFFPTGKWRSWFTSTDIRLALREGCKLHKVHQVYVFEAFRDFAAYAEQIYKLRREATTDFRKLVLKYLLNSLYGKCSESIYKQEMLVNPDEIDRGTMQMLQPGVWLAEKEAKITHRHVIIAAVITAIARRTLYDYAKECLRQEKPAYYCDSVTGDRTVVLLSPGGDVVIEPVEDLWAKRAEMSSRRWDGKQEARFARGWKALAQDSSGKQGWFPLVRMVRHFTSKDIYLISSGRGQTRVTEDHSIMVSGEEVRPAHFIFRQLDFDVVQAPRGFGLEPKLRAGVEEAMARGKNRQTFVEYVVNTQRLAAGISFLLSQWGIAHQIRQVDLTSEYIILSYTGIRDRELPDLGVSTHWHSIDQSQGYVYDLEVDGAHTFVDGVGRVLLHNTDSLATKADLPRDDKTLGALKLEKKMDWAEFVAPKIYRGEGFELQRDGTFKPKRLTKAKGFSLGVGQEAWDKLDRIIAGDRIGVQRMTRIRELYRTMVAGQYTTAPFELLVIKALTFEMLAKRFHYPDGETRPWSVDELRSGDRIPGGFDFESEVKENFDVVTKSMLAAAV